MNRSTTPSSTTRWLAAGTGLIITAVPWLRAYPIVDGLPLLVAAIALPIAASVAISGRMAKPLRISLGSSALLWLAFCWIAVIRTPLAPPEILRGIVEGPAHLLSTALPVSEPRWFLIPAITLVWLTSTAVFELEIRGRAQSITAAALAISFSLGYAATASVPPSLDVVAAALAVDLGVLLLSRTKGSALAAGTAADQEAQRARGRHRAATGIGTLAIVAVLCGFGIPQLGRFSTPPHPVTRTATDRQLTGIAPTVAVAQLRSTPSRKLFVVTTTQRSPGYVALVNLDLYDGSAWSPTDHFSATGGTVRTQVSATGTELSQSYSRFRLGDLPWMPFMNQVRSVQGITVQFDPVSGMVLPAPGTALDRASSGYSVHSNVNVLSTGDLTRDEKSAALNGLTSGSEADVAIDASLKTTVISTWTPQIASGVNHRPEANLRFLGKLADHLRSSKARLQDKAYRTGAKADPFGTAAVDIVGTVLGPKESGSPEQYATLLAMIARGLDVPARLVTGFRLSPLDQAPAPVPAGRHVVTGSQAWTWVEVLSRTRGWVTLDPTPTRLGEAATSTSGASSAPTTTTTQPPQDRAVTEIQGYTSKAPPRPGASLAIFATLGISLLVILVLALPLIILAWLRRRRRTARRSRAEPAWRIEGAWMDVLDTLDVNRVGDLEPLTGSEVASLVSEQFGGGLAASVGGVATVAEIAIFGNRSSLTIEDSEQAWDQADLLRRGLARTIGIRRRITSLFRRPRPGASRSTR